MTDFIVEEFDEHRGAPAWARHIIRTLNRMEDRMTSFANDQAHLDADIQAIATEFATVVAELKAAALTGKPMDFTKADALVQAVTAEAAGDAPASGTGSIAPSAPGGVTPVDPTQPVNSVTGSGVNPNMPPATELPAANAPITTPPSTTASSGTVDPAPGVDPVAAPQGSDPTDASPTPTDGATPSTPSEGTVEPLPATDPNSGSAAARTLYEHVGSGEINEAEWPKSEEVAADGSALYTFAGDTQPGDATGVSADWAVYSGPTAPPAA